MPSTSSLLNLAISNSAKDAVKRFVTANQVVGLGSGNTMKALVKELANLPYNKTLELVATSIQIKIEAERVGLRISDESSVDIDVVFDGADQIDSDFNMIKGGGGALFREKVLISAANRVVILADVTKFVTRLSRPIPIEIHKFARSFLHKRLKELGGDPKLRTIEKGYPYITENGNLILDTSFSSLGSLRSKEIDLKSIPGVAEVGLFTSVDIYYKANNDGSFEIIQPKLL
ncbi:MAG TPA: ribose 5-phosphate isomerase A [Candidatus Bathyarchaeia archaeon]|jgi:ribose 5-phosphate isomerase A|nr:ribose 5-phosphate isomerase A [Candidatus Bathyarchaeia archaeon]